MTLKFCDAEKIYAGGYVGLYAFDLEISSENGIFTIFGGESEGKSTFCKMLAGLENLSAGEIFWDGNRFDKLPMRERNIAATVPKNSLRRFWSVRKNLELSLKLRRIEDIKIDNKTVKLAEIFGFLDKLDKKVNELDKKTLDVILSVRPFLRDADIFIFDGVSPEIFDTWLETARKLDGLVIYATSNLSEVEKINGHIGVASDNTLLQSGTLASIKKQPKSVNVAKMLMPDIEFKIVTADSSFSVHKTYFGKEVLTSESLPSLYYDIKNGFVI